MADFNSALPIRTELPGQSNYTDVIVKVGDATNPTTQQLGVDASGKITVKLDDAAGNGITSQANGAQQALDVGIDVGGVQIDPRQIRALTAADVVTVDQGTSPWVVSGTVAVTQSTSPWVTSDLADGAVSNGAAGTKSMLGGAIYLSSAPTLTSGNQNALLSDVNGNLLVDLKTPIPAGSNTIGAVTQASGPWTQNLTEVGGSAIALGQTTMSASIPVAIASNQSAIPVTQSGTWTVAVTQSTSPWITSDLADGSVTGGTAGTKSMLGGGIYNSTPPTLTNGQQASLQLDASGNLKVNLETPIPAGTNLIGGTTVYVGSTVASITNPLPVTVTSAVPGTPIQNYNTTASLAAGSSTTFTYTVAAGHTFSLERVWAAASGKIKVVVQNGASTIFVGFNSTANPNVDITVVAPPTIAAAGTVNVIITNDDLAPFDVYATIEGNQN
jgi:hypothetical protein